MGENSSIAWTHHTFNPWRGCTKVSDGCKFCYAEQTAERYKKPDVLGTWGPRGVRAIAVDSYWRQPFVWDRKASPMAPARVFCASLADWLEGPDTMPDDQHRKVVIARGRLLETIWATGNLHWLLLTKRPEGWCERMHEIVAQYHGPTAVDRVGMPLRVPPGDQIASRWIDGMSQPRIWAGTTIENNAARDRIEHLLKIPAGVHFLSVEPMLERVDLRPYLGRRGEARRRLAGEVRTNIDWVICGGESGHHREFHMEWARDLRDQCLEAGVPFFFKQTGDKPMENGVKLTIRGKGEKFEDGVPADLQIRQFPPHAA